MSASPKPSAAPSTDAAISAPPPTHSRSTTAAVIALLRPANWLKNVFVLAPLLFAKKTDVDSIVSAIAATVVFCLIASAIYIVNDWHDRIEDAGHPRKRNRPLASGELDGRQAYIAGASCMALAAGIGLMASLPAAFWSIVAIYIAVNLAYSIRLRNVQLLDVLIIAAGFVLRVLAGTTALDVPASQFIVLSTGLLALLLAMGKRRTDLMMESASSRRSLSGYSLEFIDVGLATLAASVIGFYALFTVSDYAINRYHADDLYITTFFVATGVLRYLQVLLAHGSYGTPTEIALEDRFIQVVVVGWVMSFALIAYVL
jgi:decaprenyl-phosphate phosphoribosyltransferase